MIQEFAINLENFPIRRKNKAHEGQFSSLRFEDLSQEILQPFPISEGKGRIVEVKKNGRIGSFGHFSKFVNKV